MLNETSNLRLAGVHPRLAAITRYASEQVGVPFQVIEGVRTLERQQRLVRLGRSHTLHSRHLKQPDGYAHAVDLVAVGDLDGDGDVDARDRALIWDPAIYRLLAEDVLKAAALWCATVTWGGNFQGFFDGPHFQLDAWEAITETDDDPFRYAGATALKGMPNV